MPRHALLNNIDHRDLRIDTARAAALGDQVMSAVTYPAEFRNVQSHYPIVFQKAADGSLHPLALFGFAEGDNLFLDRRALDGRALDEHALDERGDGRGWDASYLPLAIERQPFLIGRDGEQLMLHVDLDHPRVRNDRGEPLFREHGGHTEYLERITSVLLTLHEGLASVPAFMDALLRHGLIESFALDVELADGSLNRMAGFYTINEERLRGLDAAALGELHGNGHLEPIYMVLASVTRFRDLIERMNRRRAARG